MHLRLGHLLTLAMNCFLEEAPLENLIDILLVHIYFNILKKIRISSEKYSDGAAWCRLTLLLLVQDLQE